MMYFDLFQIESDILKACSRLIGRQQDILDGLKTKKHVIFEVIRISTRMVKNEHKQERKNLGNLGRIQSTHPYDEQDYGGESFKKVQDSNQVSGTKEQRRAVILIRRFSVKEGTSFGGNIQV